MCVRLCARVSIHIIYTHTHREQLSKVRFIVVGCSTRDHHHLSTYYAHIEKLSKVRLILVVYSTRDHDHLSKWR